MIAPGRYLTSTFYPATARTTTIESIRQHLLNVIDQSGNVIGIDRRH